MYNFVSHWHSVVAAAQDVDRSLVRRLKDNEMLVRCKT